MNNLLIKILHITLIIFLTIFVNGKLEADKSCLKQILKKLYNSENQDIPWKFTENRTSIHLQTNLTDLKNAGGDGTPVNIRALSKNGDNSGLPHTGLLITSPPQEPIYGTAFNDIFAILQKYNIPVIADSTLEKKTGKGAATAIDVYFKKNKGGILFIDPTVPSDLALRHEFQHIKDLIIDSDDFINSSPRISTKLAKAIQKHLNGEGVSEFQELQIKHLKMIPMALAESRASTNSIKSVLTQQGFKEIFKTNKMGLENYIFANEASNAAAWNRRLLYHSVWVNPLDPKNLIIVAKYATSLATTIPTNLVPLTLTSSAVFLYVTAD